MIFTTTIPLSGALLFLSAAVAIPMTTSPGESLTVSGSDTAGWFSSAVQPSPPLSSLPYPNGPHGSSPPGNSINAPNSLAASGYSQNTAGAYASSGSSVAAYNASSTTAISSTTYPSIPPTTSTTFTTITETTSNTDMSSWIAAPEVSSTTSAGATGATEVAYVGGAHGILVFKMDNYTQFEDQDHPENSHKSTMEAPDDYAIDLGSDTPLESAYNFTVWAPDSNGDWGSDSKDSVLVYTTLCRIKRVPKGKDDYATVSLLNEAPWVAVKDPLELLEKVECDKDYKRVEDTADS